MSIEITRGGHGLVYEENWTEPNCWNSLGKPNRLRFGTNRTELNQTYGSVNHFITYELNQKQYFEPKCIFWFFCEFNCVFLSFFNVIAWYSKIFATLGCLQMLWWNLRHLEFLIYIGHNIGIWLQKFDVPVFMFNWTVLSR